MDQNLNDPGMEPWQEKQQRVRRDLEQKQKKERIGAVLCIMAAVLGILALLLFCSCINVPMAVVAVISGLLGVAGAGDQRTYKVMALIGMACAVLSVVLLVISWSIIGAKVPSDGVDQQYMEQILKESGYV